MTTTFITGANKSLGYETARRLIAAGHHVIVGARDPERGRAAAEALGARWVQIDVSSDESVARAAADVAEHEGAVDVLINNAGIRGNVKSSLASIKTRLRSDARRQTPRRRIGDKRFLHRGASAREATRRVGVRVFERRS